MKGDEENLATRWTLIRKLTQTDCDEESWREFYQMYQRLIHGVAIKAGLRNAEAQDIVQETMRSVCEKIHDFKPDPAHGSFKSWLLQMARWRIIDHIRKQPPAKSPSASIEDSGRTSTVARIPDPASLQLEAIWDEQWRKELFGLAVERIKEQVSPDQFQIFDFYMLRQMPVARILRSLKVSRAQVYLARHRVSKLIKKEIKTLAKKMA
jgi:RNA polymerase sigma factor (sigma-70 family)